MSMIGNTLLNEIVNEKKVYDPAEILEHLQKGVVNSLHQSDEKIDSQDDGMDISICAIDKTKNEIQYSFNSISASINLEYLWPDASISSFSLW